MFGFLEFEDDPDVVPAMLEAAAAWLRYHGRDHMIGPMDFTINDESGVMIEGFEREPMIKQPWHPPYYQQRCEEAGLTKAMDLLMWELDISDREHMLPIIFTARRADRGAPRRGPAQDVTALAAARHGPLRRGLQRGLERELGLLPLLEGGPRPLRPGDAARLRPALVHGRRDEGGRDGRRGDHRPRPQPGAQEDERAAVAARLVALPAPQQDHRPRARRLPRRQAGLSSTPVSPPRSTSSTSTWPR